MKAYLTKSSTLLHQRSRIKTLHHLPQDTLLRMAFSTPPIGKGQEVDDGIEPVPVHVSLVDTIAVDIPFEGHTWGWYCINRRTVVAQNHNEPTFKNGWTPQNLSYIDIFLHCLLLKCLRIVLLPSTSRDMKK